MIANQKALDKTVATAIKQAAAGEDVQLVFHPGGDRPAEIAYVKKQLKKHGLNCSAPTKPNAAKASIVVKGVDATGVGNPEIDALLQQFDVISKSLPAYQQDFLTKARTALKDSKVSSHVKSMMKDQAEQMLHQVNNGGAANPDFDSLGQIGKLGTIQKGTLSPAGLRAQLAKAMITATIPQQLMLTRMDGQIDELERVMTTADNAQRVAKSEPVAYTAQNAATAQLISQAIEDNTRPTTTITGASTASGGTSGARGNVAAVLVNQHAVGGVSGLADGSDPAHGIGTRPVLDSNPELQAAEAALVKSTDVFEKRDLGERVTYLKLLRLHGG
jgi:hypothetical protein